jgi:phosphonate transport system ATP-binding protein
VSTPVIEARAIRKVFGSTVVALDGVTLSVLQGQMVAIIGLSGAGKSTFLRCVNRLVEPSSGQMLVDGRDVTHIQGAAFRQLRTGIGMIFQQFNLVKRLSVLSNVLTGRLGYVPILPSWFHRFSSEDVDVAFDCLQRVGIADRAFDRADKLSGGQQQRVAIARALAQRPRLMLADEPVASLDPETSRVVLGYLRQINRDDGITTVVNLHQLDYAREYADRIVGFRQGRMVFDGTPDEVNDDIYQRVYVA